MGDDTRRTGRLIGAAVALLLAAGAVVGFRSLDLSESTGPDDSLGTASTTIPGLSETGPSDLQGSMAATTTTMAASADIAAGKSAGGGAAASTAAPSPIDTHGAVGAPLPVTGQPRIVKNATIALEVGKGRFREAFDSAASVAGGHGGFVVSSDSNVQKGQVSTGLIVLRVPADTFDAVRAELVKIGTVKDEHLSGDDVSGQLVDLDARIRSLGAQEDAIRALMAKARTIGETIEIQGQLTQVRQQIEQLSGEKARLDNAASFATIRVQLAEPGAAVQDPTPKPKAQPSPLRHSVTLAVHGAETVLAGTIIVLGWVVPLSLLVLLGWLLWRRTRPAPQQA